MVRFKDIINEHREYTSVPIDSSLLTLFSISYASNGFPQESYPWNCDDEGLYFYGQPRDPRHAAHVYWQGFQDAANPFNVTGWQGTCQFPQLSSGGLDDAWQHGHDLWKTYHEHLRFLPREYDGEKMSFRVTTNVITSQVAGMVIGGMFGDRKDIPLLVQVRRLFLFIPFA